MRFLIREYKSLPPATKFLVTAIFIGYFTGLAAGYRADMIFGLVPAQVVHSYWFWQPLTYMFLHGGFLHILFNGFMLWTLGSIVESAWGSREFLKYFFITGAGAALFNIALTPYSSIPIIGASGAIYGLLVAFGFLHPNAKLALMFVPVPIAAKYFIPGLLLLDLFSGVTGFSIFGAGIAHFAHLGGALIGFLLMLLWRRRTAASGPVRFQGGASESAP